MYIFKIAFLHRKRSTSLEGGSGESRGRPLGGWSDHWHKENSYSRKLYKDLRQPS